MKKEFADIHSLYENLYEDLQQLDEIGPVSKSQKLKARQAKLNQQNQIGKLDDLQIILQHLHL